MYNVHNLRILPPSFLLLVFRGMYFLQKRLLPIHQINYGLHFLSKASWKVSNWAKFNCLKLNAGKTKAIAFGSSHLMRRFKELQITSIAINNDGDIVQFVDEVVSLGVVLDSTLSWRTHINSITKKVNRALFGLRFIRHCTTPKLR